jgi:hypothetical protein
MKQLKANRDESLEEIWAIRRQIAEKLGLDPKNRAAYYQEKQKQLGGKILKRKDISRL